jgi:hypothetical protein
MLRQRRRAALPWVDSAGLVLVVMTCEDQSAVVDSARSGDNGQVESVAIIVALAPIVATLILLALSVRKLWRPPLSDEEPWIYPSPGADPAGVREPRRPPGPSGAAGVRLVEPDADDQDDLVAIAPSGGRASDARPQLRAS